jgi:hypothetical protein
MGRPAPARGGLKPASPSSWRAALPKKQPHQQVGCQGLRHLDHRLLRRPDSRHLLHTRADAAGAGFAARRFAAATAPAAAGASGCPAAAAAAPALASLALGLLRRCLAAARTAAAAAAAARAIRRAKATLSLATAAGAAAVATAAAAVATAAAAAAATAPAAAALLLGRGWHQLLAAGAAVEGRAAGSARRQGHTKGYGPTGQGAGAAGCHMQRERRRPCRQCVRGPHARCRCSGYFTVVFLVSRDRVTGVWWSGTFQAVCFAVTT